MNDQLQAHRGVLILVLGILGLVLCQILGPIAWIMGKGDMAQMDQGRMDPEGRGLTQAGMICGIIATILMVLGILFFVGTLVLGLGAAATNGGYSAPRRPARAPAARRPGRP